mmetsp:Transcript_3860/g.7461  ORF Transcript_3860/g.7461 Transcript_3860/m.7461 type:complete len:540 (-) Transcript_3860:49-1668(-)
MAPLGQGEEAERAVPPTAGDGIRKGKQGSEGPKIRPNMLSMKKGLLALLTRLAKMAFLDSKALKTLFINFLLAYNVRAGVSVLLRILTVMIRKPKDALSIQKLLGESNLVMRVEAVRVGLFIGGFTSLYKAVVHSLEEVVSSGEHKRWHSAVGGWIAGLSLYSMDKSWHRTLGLYMATRAAQSAYNYAKLNGYWHFWGSDWEYGDALLFTLSSAQVMYAYVMRPETLPGSYYKFIVRQGPIDEKILQAVRDSNRGRAINLPAVMEYVRKSGGEEAVQVVKKHITSETTNMVPCRALHPYTRFCSMHTLNAFINTAKQIFPVYLSLALVPAVVLRFKHFAAAPTTVLGKSLLGAARSTAFLGLFCSGYQGVICVQREVLQHLGYGDHKLWYYFAGVLSSLSILIERKSRRSELALYAFPRAMDSLYMIMYDHKLAISIPQGEVVLFCSAMSFVMYIYQNHTDCMSPLVVKLLDRFLPKRAKYDASKKDKVFVPFVASDNTTSDSEEDSDVSSSKTPQQKGISMKREQSVVSLSGGYSMVP